MKRMNLFATPDELQEIVEMVNTARTAPVMALSSAAALSGNDFSSLAWKEARKLIHETAMKHGLPDTPGFYGIDQENGEFLSEH